MIINDNYTPNMYKIGRWQIDVSATDKSGNTGYGMILVIVEDVTSPVIEGLSTYTSYMSNLILESTIRENLRIIDNVDELSIESLNVIEDTYTNSNSVGEYKIKYQAIDLSGNVSAIFEVKINMANMKTSKMKSSSSSSKSSIKFSILHSDVPFFVAS